MKLLSKTNDNTFTCRILNKYHASMTNGIIYIPQQYSERVKRRINQILTGLTK